MKDILTIDDVALEVRVAMTMMRKRKERAQRENAAELRQQNHLLAAQLWAVSGYPQRLMLPR